MIEVVLKKGKEKAVWQRHPWVFSGAMEQVTGSPEDGEVVCVRDSSRDFLAYGYFNSGSRIAVRLLEWNEGASIDKSWYEQKIRAAIQLRKGILDEKTDSCRLIFSEADFLPGLIVDKYGDYLSVQILSAGIDKVCPIIIDILVKTCSPLGIFDKSDVSARAHENMGPTEGVLWGEVPPQFIEIQENGIKYHVNITEGQKSGFYCDQRDNRAIVASYARGKNMLDCFSYSGGFALNALKGGASHVVTVDSSSLAVETLRKNVLLNELSPDGVTAIQNDVNKQLRKFKDEGNQFDIVILDPPKYAPSRSALDRAARAYKDLNRLGMGLVRSGGLLATFSCSGAADLETFKQIIAWAALDAGREVQVIRQFHQPEDHPVRLSFPEGEYLKGLLLRVLD